MKVDLVFKVQDGECHVQTKAVLYMLEDLLTDVILGIDFLKQYNPSISWVDSLVGMPCLVENDGVCQSSPNSKGSHMNGASHGRMTTCSNGMLCKKMVLVSTK